MYARTGGAIAFDGQSKRSIGGSRRALSRDLSRSEQEDWQRAADIAARFHMDTEKQALIDLGLRTIREGDAVTMWSMARAMRGMATSCNLSAKPCSASHGGAKQNPAGQIRGWLLATSSGTHSMPIEQSRAETERNMWSISDQDRSSPSAGNHPSSRRPRPTLRPDCKRSHASCRSKARTFSGIGDDVSMQ